MNESARLASVTPLVCLLLAALLSCSDSGAPAVEVSHAVLTGPVELLPTADTDRNYTRRRQDGTRSQATRSRCRSHSATTPAT
jgi:hypothetical protein